MSEAEVSSIHHPSDETLAAFVDGRLDPPSRKVVVEHIATCDDCRASWEAVAEFAAMSETEASSNVTQGNFRRGRWYSLTAVAAAIAVGFLLWPFVETYRNRDLLVEASASRDDRPSLARLSGEHPYKPAKPTLRGDDDRKDTYRVLIAADEIDKAARRHRTVENLRQLAAVRLLAEQWDDAVAAVEEAVRLDADTDDTAAAIAKSSNAALLTDVAAAYYARATHRQNPTADYLSAYGASKRAWTLSRAPQAAWNLAVAAEQLGYADEARQMWAEYLRLDPSSEWATEARERMSLLDEDASTLWAPGSANGLLAALQRRDETNVRLFVVAHPGECRQFGEEELLGAWGERPTEANLAALELLGKVIAQTSGDRFLADAVAAVRAAPDALRHRLAAAHAAYRKARRSSDHQPSQALVRYGELAETFAEVHSPFAMLIAIRKAGCIQRRMEYGEALRVLDGAGEPELLAKRGYLALAAQAEWTRGMIHVDSGLPDAALRAFEHAVVWFGVLGERPNEAGVRALAAQAADVMGAGEIALAHRLEALRLQPGAPARTQHLILMSVAPGLSAAGHREAAAAAYARLIALGRQDRDAFLVCYGLLFRSLHHSRNAEPQLARRDFEEAAPHCSSIADPATRARVAENEAYVAGTTAIEGRTVLASLDLAIDIAEKTGSLYRRAVLYAQRARLHLNGGDVASARADAARALEDMQKQLQSVQQPEFRASWIDATRDLISSRIDAELAARQMETAFAAAEWHRAQSRVERGTNAAPMASLDDVRRIVAEDAAVLAFHAGAERLTTFVVRSRGTHVHSEAISRADLDRQVALFREAIAQDGAEAIDRHGRALHEILIAPLAAFLDGVRTLVIIPDSALAALPFAALRDQGERFLVETFTVTSMPSASAFVASNANVGNGVAGKPWLVLGARQLNDQGRVLADPRREIERLEGLYGEVHVLRDDTATAQAFLASSAAAEVIQYSGHAVTNERRPMMSALVLPRAGGGTEFVYAHQIARRDWSRVRLLLLAACSTGRRDGAVRPFGSLAETFVQAGVQSVIGSLWDVDDRLSRAATERIHRAVRNGESAARALRQMQLAMLQSATPALRSPRVWAAWMAVGAGDGRAAGLVARN